MLETGHTWHRCFKGAPEEARNLRRWVGERLRHTDAQTVAHELFVAVLGSKPVAIDATLSTSGDRVRISVGGESELSPLQTHGPGAVIVRALSTATGIRTDGCALWAEMRCHPNSQGQKAS
ncbi:hypothetical protein [Streptomyces sp. NBC_01465]|uniref:hypothetical protein n=1 Tax=Streptomyces sp. NBC_01465 TaxID=2903878 RepID=UPI002E325633|nr:hypothetical protein [Streptomyces sp. NBC_01465]